MLTDWDVNSFENENVPCFIRRLHLRTDHSEVKIIVILWACKD